MNPLMRYTRWLHTRWPAGTVEKLPTVREDGTTSVPGLYVTGDLTGVPLLKFSADSGARAIASVLAEPGFAGRSRRDDVLDVAIIGGGVSGASAAIAARKAGLSFTLFEASEPFSTIVNFPRAKPIYTYPTDMVPAGDLQFHERSSVKEGLLEDLRAQVEAAGIETTIARIAHVKRAGGVFELQVPGDRNVTAHRVIVAIGRSGNFRRLGVPGEDKGKVCNRLHDPRDFCGRKVLVVGGGDSALETAVALATCGSEVTLSYRKPAFSRPKPENIEKIDLLSGDARGDTNVASVDGDRVTTPSAPSLRPEHGGSLRLLMASRPKAIDDDAVVVTDSGGRDRTIANDAVFTMIGREAPLDFFRRSGVRISGELGRAGLAAMVCFVLFIAWVYHWKSNKPLPFMKQTPGWLDSDLSGMWRWLGSLGAGWQSRIADASTLPGTLAISAGGGAFFYTLAYSIIVVWFGVRRIRRRRTPYVKVQTTVLASIQVLPLFLLPEIILPLMGHNGLFDEGLLRTIADGLFPMVGYGHGREYWRAYGFVLAWPLMVWNLFTDQPQWWWIVITFLQTFVLIPLMIRRVGKGAYCGWICSCGALAETLGDAHRHKMPHGPAWNRLNMIGQAFLLFAFVLLVLRVLGWIFPDAVIGRIFHAALTGKVPDDVWWSFAAWPLAVLNYAWLVDVLWAGIIGYGFYFWFSGRVWCRFACPLAALMHLYARFSRFAIVADKKKCISCNVCTSVCHQGIDVMNFANKGLPMQDPECVRCSACVQGCPTGVLTFGRVDRDGHTIGTDPAFLAASPVQMAELTVEGRGGGSDQ